MKRLRTFALALALYPSAVFAQQAAQYERLLLPVAFAGELQGGFGSRWVTQVAITNAGVAPAAVIGYAWRNDICVNPPCPVLLPPPIPPGTTIFPTVLGNPRRAGFLAVSRDAAAGVRVQLRAQDVSRQRQTWGTELPVVRESEFRTTPFGLIDIPTGAEFRRHLRLYDADARNDARVRVRTYALDDQARTPEEASVRGDELLSDVTVPLDAFRSSDATLGPLFSYGYAEITDLVPAGTTTARRVRIEIEPLTAGLRVWGFISVTNNETQHITTITPQ